MTAISQIGVVKTPLARVALARPASRWWPLPLLATLFLALAIRTWDTWADPLIDFGRELYVPWRMIAGDVLYRDLAYFNGPLSPAVNALWFRLFGASLRTLELANLALLAATTALLFAMLRRIASRGAAALACATFLALFAFAQYTRTRNYNYVCPYSHEMTHGLLCALAALAASWRVGRGQRRYSAAAGFCVGLAALTKPEMTVAAASGAMAGLLLASRAGGADWGVVARRFLYFGAGAIVPIAIAVAWLSRSMPLAEATASCFGAWQMATNPAVSGLAFYRRGLGIFDVGESLLEIAVSSARWIVGLGVAAALACVGRVDRQRTACILAAALGSAAGCELFLQGFAWPLLERALPVLLAGLAVWQMSGLRRGVLLPDDTATQALRVSWCLFALAMLAKIALASRICQYGFVLAAPAALTVVVAMLDWAPAAANRRGFAGAAIACLFAPLLFAYALAYQAHQSTLIDRSVTLGAGADQIAAPSYAASIAEAYAQIESRVGVGETLETIPEGIMLNFLTGRRAATRFVSWMPPEVAYFGEANMLAALAATPPDCVLIAPRGLGEYGVGQFGRGFADSISAWIDAHYEPIAKWNAGAPIGDELDRSRREWRLMRRAR